MATTRRKRRKNLGSTKTLHTARAAEIQHDLKSAAATLVDRARQGKCTAATMAYAKMHNAIGHIEAHARSGGSAYLPTTTIQDASYEYWTRCVTPVNDTLGARKPRRKARS